VTALEPGLGTSGSTPTDVRPLRLVAWNCDRGFATKSERLDSLAWDVAVVSECSPRDADSYAGQAGIELVWDGAGYKGLAVFARPPFRLTLDADYEPRLELVLPMRVGGPVPFNLLAAWTKKIRLDGRDARYVRLLHLALDRYQRFIEERPTVLMGDLNSNSVFDREHPASSHTLLVDRLSRLGLRSAYHHCCGELHGAESMATHYFLRKRERPFHIDYCFIPEAWLNEARVDVGMYKDWVPTSDHVPLSVELDAGRFAAPGT
jgi:hypothetical protein